MYFLGDTHGNFNYVKWFIDQRKIRNTHIIHVGDYGVGFNTEFNERNKMGQFNKWLQERGLTMHVFRGNHDNPNYFNGEFMYEHLKFHPDYTILEIEGKKILGVGGALSIDRVPRRKMTLIESQQGRDTKYHWDDEKFVLDIDKIKNIEGIDIVVTHTAPDFVYPVNNGKTWPYIVEQFFGEDPTLGNELMEERNTVTKLYDILVKNNNIENYFYGHFHHHNIDIIGNCQFTCLDINQLYELV